MGRLTKSFSRKPVRGITRSSGSREAIVLFVTEFLVIAGGWISTTITHSWLFGVCSATAATALFLLGWIAHGLDARRSISKSHHTKSKENRKINE